MTAGAPDRLRRRDLPSDSVSLARYLIGKLIVRDDGSGRTSGRIVETEAYLLGDPACHAYRGRTPRNGSLFLERGHAYVYRIYGISLCLNVSSEAPECGAGVLIRALEPVDGLAAMQKRRGDVALRDLARGPGRLTKALGVGMADDGLDLCADGPLWLARARGPAAEIGESVRIGLSVAADEVLRFYERSSTYVSGPRWLSP